MPVLAELTPLDPATGNHVTLRASSSDDRAVCALNGVRWWPALADTPEMSIRLFDGEFSTPVAVGGASLTALVDKLARLDPSARRFLWTGAGVKLYAARSGTAWPWPQVFEGSVERFEAQFNKLKLQAKVNTEPFEANVLTASYAGTGGAEGGADIKGNPKPWIFGRALNVEPVLIDSVNSVYQFSAYAPIKAVNALYERASDYGAAQGDYATYAALVAATIPPAKWATCLASGMIRLGAPPEGVITGDVDGDYAGGTWRRLTGAILTRIASVAGVASGVIDAASLAALDTAVPYNVNIVLTEQVSVLDLAQRMALPCNAQAGVGWLGKLFVTRMVLGSPALTLDAQGRRKPQVSESTESDVRPPFWRVSFGAKRSWRVHSFDEVAFAAPIVDRGLYGTGNTYREGNIVSLADGSRYLYISTTPTAGNAPPNTTYWAAFDGATVVDFANVGGATKPADNATVNRWYVATSDPGGANGDGWKDTSTTPAKFKFKVAGSWVDVSSLVTDTAQITDGANLGLTALWIGIAGTGKPEDNADVTLLITGPDVASPPIARDTAGTVKTGELPRDFSYKITAGTTDVTTSASWSAAIKTGSGTATFTPTAGSPNATGTVNVTACSDGAVLVISAAYGGKVRTTELALVSKQDQTPTTGGGGSGSAGTASDNTIDQTTSSSYGSANTDVLRVTAGSGGRVDLTFPGSFRRTTNGTNGAAGKWQWRAIGGTFADVASEIGSTVAADKDSTATEPYNTAGQIAVTMAKTGLTAATDYEFQLLLRNDAAGTCNWSGTASAVAS